MKRKSFIYLTAAVIILLSLLAACNKAATPTTVQNNTTTQAPGETTQKTPVATKAPPSVPSDVPVMPDAYELQVPNELNITYKVNLQIKDVVTFYQAALPENGWDQTNNPDSVVGSMAQISRAKTNGDRITFSLQYNPVGEFTIVQIFLTRIATPQG